jgi:hypothetical protein
MTDSELTDAKMAIADELCEPPKCEDCKLCDNEHLPVHFGGVIPYGCRKLATHLFCIIERDYGKVCGPEGKLFEAKEGRSDV